MELNPVAKDAQRKVPLPENIDLDQPINSALQSLLQVPIYDDQDDDDEFSQYYTQRPAPSAISSEPAANRLNVHDLEVSYQESHNEDADADALLKKRAERRERHKDDPYYIPSEETSGRATPIHSILRANNGTEVDLDSIPIMKLELGGGADAIPRQTLAATKSSESIRYKPSKAFEILAEETVGESGDALDNRPTVKRAKKSLLQVDSSGLGSLSLGSEGGRVSKLDAEKRAAEEAEMARAIQEVERLRLEMQRNAERIEGPAEGTVVRRMKKSKPKGKTEAPSFEDPEASLAGDDSIDPEAAVKTKKKKKKPRTDEADKAVTEAVGKKKKKKKPVGEIEEKEDEKAFSGENEPETQQQSIKKKKKRRQITFDDHDGDGTQEA